MPRLTALVGDSREVLRTLPSGSVHLVVTSPPYDDLRLYGGHGWSFEVYKKIIGELYRVLAPGGLVCWNVADGMVNGSETLTSFRQAIYAVDVIGFRQHDTMIWNKLNFSHPEKTRYHPIFEYIFLWSKGAPRVFNPIKDKPNKIAGQLGSLGAHTFTERDGSKSHRERRKVADFGMRTNVWTGPTRGQEVVCLKLKHPAMMPRWLASDLIRSWSNAGDTVLDPFGGSGTTAQEAVRMGRDAITIEINPEYAPMQDSAAEVGLPLDVEN